MSSIQMGRRDAVTGKIAHDAQPKVYPGRLEAVFDASTMATALVRFNDGRFLAVNERCKRILHVTNEAIEQGVDTSMVGLVSDELDAVRTALETEGFVHDLEMTVEREGHPGRRLVGAMQMVVIDDERCVVANFIDITKQRQLRQELQRTQEQLRLFLDLAPAVIALKGLDGRLLWVNKTAAESFDISPDLVQSKTNFDFMEADLAEQLAGMDASVIRSGAMVREEVSLKSPAGDDLTYDVVKFPVTDAHHRMYAIGTIGTDMTERLQVDHALRESEARFRQLAENMDGVFLLWRVQPAEILYVSPAVERLLGVPAESADFATLFAAAHPDDQPTLLSEIVELDTWDRQVIVDFRVIHTNGNIRWVRSRTARVLNVDGDLRRTTILIDVTDEKLAVERLEQARASADRSSNAKNDFLSRMSHELRTPLHAILGFDQLLDLEPLTDVQREFTDQIARAGGHLLRLIDEVLDISQIEGGFMRLSMAPLSLLRVVNEALELIEPVARDAACTVSVLGDLAGITVLADRTRLKQVLLNVVSNAIKYNTAGGEVAISVELDADRTVRINVVDDGVGIAADAMGRLFEPFDRLGAEQTRVPGTGLGLALARQLMELMGGSIGADSTVGVGTRFWMELAAADESDTKPHLRPVHRPQSIGDSRDRPVRVLVIENDPASVVLLEAVFRQRPSLNATFARSGAEGLAILREHDLDFVLLDLHLSDMSGIEVLSRIRSDSICPGAQIVVLSADAVSRTMQEALALGASAYLTKPFDVEELWGVLDNLVVAKKDGLSFVYADDDDLCRRFMSHMFERYLPNARLTLVASGRTALELVRSNPPDILLLDVHLADISGFDVMEAVRQEAATATMPIIFMSADNAQHDWEDTQLTHWLGKPFTVNDFLSLVASLS